jgi:hypothetical protein
MNEEAEEMWKKEVIFNFKNFFHKFSNIATIELGRWEEHCCQYIIGEHYNFRYFKHIHTLLR